MTVVELTAAQQMVRQVAEETGVWLSPSSVEGLTRKQAIEMAQQVAARQKRRAGVKALQRKYGHEAASQIVFEKSGRRIRR